jgi:hypothetical protein
LTAGCETLCFFDAYSGYHQIAMCIADQLTTSCITPFGAYCYNTMPFGLNNAGATFQRCMRRVFGELIGASSRRTLTTSWSSQERLTIWSPTSRRSSQS